MLHQGVLDMLEEMRKRGLEVRTNGGTDLDLTRDDFACYLMIEADGWQLMTAFESGGNREAEKAKLLTAKQSPQGIRFLIPSWQKFIDFMRLLSRGTSLEGKT